MTRVIGRVLAIAFAIVGVSMLSPQIVAADEVGGEEIEVPPRAMAPTPEPVIVTKEVPVSSPPPPFVELERGHHLLGRPGARVQREGPPRG